MRKKEKVEKTVEINKDIALYYSFWWTKPEWISRFKKNNVFVEGKPWKELSDEDYYSYRSSLSECSMTLKPYTKNYYLELFSK